MYCRMNRASPVTDVAPHPGQGNDNTVFRQYPTLKRFSPKQQFRNFIRLNCGAPWSQAIDQALLKLGQVIARML